MGRSGALDGLRGIALGGVVAYHAGWLAGGWLGVEVFFVLSGYLLTPVLLRRHAATGSLDWRGYARARGLRLLPALSVLVAALVIATPFVAHDDAHRLPGDVMAALSGAMNWHLIVDNSSYFGGLGRPSLLRHLWSLAVEIQFYALCPMLVAWLVRRPRLAAMSTLGWMIAASAAVLGFAYDAVDPTRAYFGTDARIGAPLIGVLLAFALEGRTLRLPSATGPAAGLVLLGLFAVADDTSRLAYPAAFLAASLATALLIAVARSETATARVLDTAPLKWLGVRSYGIYLWHWPLVALLRPGIDVGWSPMVAATVAVVGALVLGAVSYRFVEAAAQRYQASSQRSTRALSAVVAVTTALGVTALTVQLPRVDPIVESLRAGEALVAAQASAPPPTTTPVAVTTTTMVPTTVSAPPVVQPVSQPVSRTRPAARTAPAPRPQPAAPAPRPLPPGPAPGTVSVTAIGDSVMVGAAEQLSARLGPSGYIDAKVSRQFHEAAAVAANLRSQGRLGDVVVVHLGTNGPPRDSDVDALMRELAGVRHVVFVTVRMPRRWQDQTNAGLRAIPNRYAATSIADWFAYSEGHPEYFRSDGVHLSSEGAQAFADLIGSSIPPPPPPPTTTTSTTVPPTTTTTRGLLS